MKAKTVQFHYLRLEIDLLMVVTAGNRYLNPPERVNYAADFTLCSRVNL